MGLINEIARRFVQEDIAQLKEGLEDREQALDTLQERLAELELALEDIGWQKVMFNSDKDFTRDGLRKINKLARLFWLSNPLIRRAVLTQTQYVFGQGINVQARHDLVNEVIQDFLDDPKNKAELTSHQARMIKENELQILSNLFFVFFVNKSTGRVRIRTIDVDEVADIICNPDDAKDPWYYRRVWNERRLDGSGNVITLQKEAYYPDWRYNPQRSERLMSIGGKPVLWDSPVYHVRVNALSDMKFGVSEVYAAIDWARAYKEFLENWATIVKAHARFAWQMKTKGGTKGVAKARGKLKTTLDQDSTETNPPPATGSTFIGTEGVDLQPVRTAGATTKAEDGRRLLLMVAAAMGIIEHYFGDPSTGNLATATAMERPMELMFRDRQTLWADVHEAILQFVIDQEAKAPNGRLKGREVENGYGERVIDLENDPETGEPIDRHVDVTFPAILEHNVKERVEAIIKAATLEGQQAAGTIDLKTLTRMLLVALGEDDVDAMVAAIWPEEEDEETKLVFSRGGQAQQEEVPSIESAFTESLIRLREVVARIEQREGAA